jgi:chromosome partitioning protein
MRRIAIVNQKGGCGKTTTSINLAGLFAKRGQRTLLVDMDPQSHCAAGLAIPEGRIDQDIGDAMLAPDPERLDHARLLWRVSRNLDLAPSRMKLAGLEAGRGGLAEKPDKELRLARVLDSLARNYDLCCIDCSPSIGLLTFNALAAATEVLIPVETSYFSLQGAAKQLNTIRSLEKRLGVSAPCWLLPTIHDEASALARDLLEELRRRYGNKVLPTVIRLDPTLKEAASFGQPIAEYSPTSKGALDYGALGDWLIGHARPEADPTDAPVRIEEPPAEPSPPPEIRIVTEPDAQAAMARRIVHAPEMAPMLTVPALEAAAAAVLIEPPEVGFLPREDPTGPQEIAPAAPALSRAEDMVVRARKLISRGEQLAQRRAAASGSGPVAVLEPAPPPSPAMLAPLAAFAAPQTSSNPAVSAAERRTGPALGVVYTPSGCLFVQPLAIGRLVCIAGDFNNWSPVSHRLSPNPARGIHELCIPLPPGRRLYRLVVDGRWSADPFNPVVETNPFGEPNSVAVVPAPSAE